MNTKKFVVSLICALSFSATFGTIAASAYENVYSNPLNKSASVFSYSFRYSGTYANHYGYSTHTAIASKTGNTTSTKNVNYNIFATDSSGQFYSIGADGKIDTASSVVTDGITPPPYTVRREHYSTIYKGSYPEMHSAVISG